mgnify:CR=1 FL=1
MHLKILAALWDSGIITAVAYFGIKLLKAHTKNKNITMFNIMGRTSSQLR